MADGACRGQASKVRNPWYPEHGDSVIARQAQEVCKGCPVRVDCLGWAITNAAGKHGIWAGFSERKLRRVKSAWKRVSRRAVLAESPWALGALDELSARGLPWGGKGGEDEDA